MIPKLKSDGYSRDGRRLYFFGGGGGGGGSSTGTQTQIQDLPEWAKPYAQETLGKAQALTSQPYQTYDAPRIAGFSPLQQQAQQGVANLQLPSTYGQAAGTTAAGISGLMGTAQQARGLFGLGQQAAMSGQRYAQQATDPNAVGAYMNPYLQQSLAPQIAEAQRQSAIAGNQLAGQAVQSGAFGGSRYGLQQSELQRNLGQNISNIVGQGYNQAFNQAQQAQQFGAGLGLQGLQAGAGMFGQGIGAQQQAYGQALGGAGQLANIGGQALQAQQGILSAQAQAGAQQQALEQQGLSQAYQDFLNQQNYPYKQLGFMTDIMKGTPTGQSTAMTMYQGPLSPIQAMGSMGLGAYGMKQLGLFAEGGEVEGYADGGSVESPDNVANIVSKLSDTQLAQALKTAQARGDFEQVQAITAEQAMRASERGGVAGAFNQLPYPTRAQMAKGGMVAFADGGIPRFNGIGPSYVAPGTGVLSDMSSFQNFLRDMGMSGADYMKLSPKDQAVLKSEFAKIGGTPSAPAPTAAPAAPAATPAAAVATEAAEAAPRGLSGALSSMKGIYSKFAPMAGRALGWGQTAMYSGDLNSNEADQLRKRQIIGNLYPQGNIPKTLQEAVSDPEINSQQFGQRLAAFYKAYPDQQQAVVDSFQPKDGAAQAAPVTSASPASPASPAQAAQGAARAAAPMAQPVGAGPVPDYMKRGMDLADQIAKMTPSKLEDRAAFTEKEIAERQRQVGVNPAIAQMQKYLEEGETERKQSIEQGKGLAALAAMQALAQPGGTIRGLAGAGAAFGQQMGKVMEADRAEKRALHSAQINLLNAQHQEKAGNYDAAQRLYSEYKQDQRQADQFGLLKINTQANIIHGIGQLDLQRQQIGEMAKYRGMAAESPLIKLAEGLMKKDPNLTFDKAFNKAVTASGGYRTDAMLDINQQKLLDQKRKDDISYKLLEIQLMNPKISSQERANIQTQLSAKDAKYMREIGISKDMSGSPSSTKGNWSIEPVPGG